MSDDKVCVQVAHGHYRMMPLVDVVAAGGVKAGTKTWPSGLSETVWEIPGYTRQAKDDGRRGLGNGRVVLTERERKSIERQIGVPVRDAQDARRKMKLRGIRPVEKGEFIDEVTKAHEDYAASGGEARGEPPPFKFPG